MANAILVPVDGSAAALRALEYAGERKRGAAGELSIIVLNVQIPLPPSRYVTRAMVNEHHKRMANQALRPARALARRQKFEVRFCVRQGEPAETIIRFAKKMKCGEIIMGTRGRGHMAALVLGSVALKVVQLAKIPVTLVK